jgi:hypothetical protein
VIVRLDAPDRAPIAIGSVATLPPAGNRGTTWQFGIKADRKRVFRSRGATKKLE